MTQKIITKAKEEKVMKKVEIYKVEYNISNRPNENWEAFVAGFDSPSVIKYVRGFVKDGNVVVNSMTTMCRLDAVTDELRRFIAQPLIGKQVNKESEPESEEEVVVEENNNIPIKKKSIVPKG